MREHKPILVFQKLAAFSHLPKNMGEQRNAGLLSVPLKHVLIYAVIDPSSDPNKWSLDLHFLVRFNKWGNLRFPDSTFSLKAWRTPVDTESKLCDAFHNKVVYAKVQKPRLWFPFHIQQNKGTNVWAHRSWPNKQYWHIFIQYQGPMPYAWLWNALRAETKEKSLHECNNAKVGGSHLTKKALVVTNSRFL